MPLTGTAKRDYQREYMRRRRAAQAQARAIQEGTAVLPKSEVRQMHKAGLSPEQVHEAGSAFAALLRERDALKAALEWRKTASAPPITESARAKADLASIQRLGDELRERDRHIGQLERAIERLTMTAMKRAEANEELAKRVTLLEAERALADALNQ